MFLFECSCRSFLAQEALLVRCVVVVVVCGGGAATVVSRVFVVVVSGSLAQEMSIIASTQSTEVSMIDCFMVWLVLHKQVVTTCYGRRIKREEFQHGTSYAW